MAAMVVLVKIRQSPVQWEVEDIDAKHMGFMEEEKERLGDTCIRWSKNPGPVCRISLALAWVIASGSPYGELISAPKTFSSLI